MKRDAEPAAEPEDGGEEAGEGPAPRKRNTRGRMDLGREIAMETGKLPQKKFFRQRAHCNPLSFNETFDGCVRTGGGWVAPVRNLASSGFLLWLVDLGPKQGCLLPFDRIFNFQYQLIVCMIFQACCALRL